MAILIENITDSQLLSAYLTEATDAGSSGQEGDTFGPPGMITLTERYFFYLL